MVPDLAGHFLPMGISSDAGQAEGLGMGAMTSTAWVPIEPVLPKIKISFIPCPPLNDQHQIDIHGGRRKEETVETVQDAAVTGNDVARILDAGDPFLKWILPNRRGVP